jgi:hypothetical protein
MTIGDKNRFALESHIETIAPSLGHVALGFFLIHLESKEYGVRKSDATMLGCSTQAVEDRIRSRGKHVGPFGLNIPALALAQATVDLLYADESESHYFGVDASTLEKSLLEGQLLWAPDGDEAFDDGSKVIQYDEFDLVRLIGFRYHQDFQVAPESLADVIITADEYYGVLLEWKERFFREVEKLRHGISEPTM